jgi:hypothetical protein
MTFDEEATCSRVASSRVRIAALAVALAASLSAAGPSLASGSAAPTTHPGNSGNSANARPAGNSSKATSKGKPPTTPGHGAPTSGSANAIAQSIGAASIALTELDGSTVSITVTPSTRVFVNGSHASLDGVKPGFVVSATWVADKARLLEAFNLAAPGGVDVGIVASVSAKAIVVTRSDGSKVTVRVGRRTRVLLDGDPATRSAVKAGDTVVYSPRLKRNSAAAMLRFLRPG